MSRWRTIHDDDVPEPISFVGMRLSPAALRTASDWLSTFRNHWDRRLDQLDRLLTATPITTPATTTTQEPS